MAYPELLIFDCDGVLIDSEGLAARVHAAALRRAGQAVDATTLIRRFTGVPDAEMCRILELESGRSLPADYGAVIASALETAYRLELRPVPGVEGALAALTGRRCVASSSMPAKLRLGLELTGLYDHFAPHVYSAAVVPRGKPAPDLFLHAAAAMGVAAAACLVIEDSVAGVTAALAAGMPALGFVGGSHCVAGDGERLAAAGAVAVFANMALLPTLVDQAASTRSSKGERWGSDAARRK